MNKRDFFTSLLVVASNPTVLLKPRHVSKPMFSECKNINMQDVSEWDMREVTSIARMR